jgi:hypothetical protein
MLSLQLWVGVNCHLTANFVYSPSSLTSKNELLRGGLSTLKSAGNLVAKKFDEIKEAISANSTPVKPSLGYVLYCICFVARTFFIVYVSSRR